MANRITAWSLMAAMWGGLRDDRELAPWHPRFRAGVSHNGPMSEAHDFKLALTRVIEPTGGPGAELATLEDAARFIGLMRPWRQRGRIGTMRRSWCSSPRPRAKRRTSRERQRRWSERYGVTIGCDDAAEFLLAR